MKSIGVSVSVIVLAVSACSGKLEVGDDRQGQKVDEGDSGTSAGGEGGATPSTTDGDGGVSGSSSASTTGSNAPPVPPAPGSSEECPIGPVRDGDACETEGITCEYHREPPYQPVAKCFCTRASGDRQLWNCSSYTSRNELEFAEPPETLDFERLVGELTDEEREIWCDWYSRLDPNDPNAHEPAADRPVVDGYVDGGACMFDTPFCHANAPVLSKSQCIANLSLSECESPLSNLTQCATDVLGYSCAPFDYSCLDYLEAPNCDVTIITPFDGETRCDVRVE